MGTIDKKTWQQNRARNGGKAAKKTNQYPLRKVVGVESIDVTGNANYVRKERLECGHLVHPRSDMIGETNAYRRRCYHCFAAQQDLRKRDGSLTSESTSLNEERHR